MAEYRLSVEVHCTRPNWVFDPVNKDFSASHYRLYLNNELLIERTWVWENSNFIKEDMKVSVAPGTICSLKLEPVIKNIAQAKFKLQNLSVNTYPRGQQHNDLEISFVI